MPLAYHVQFGQMRQVGRFVAELDGLERGQSVVVESSRGIELGRVVAETSAESVAGPKPRIVRVAGSVDVERARTAEAQRNRQFDECRRVFEDGIWPIEPIDLEPLLEEGRAVLYYFGPHQLDVSGLRAAFLSACGLDLVFEPVGRDVPLTPEPEPEAEHGCGDCGSGGGCGTGGGCGSSGEGQGGGCSGCAVSTLVSSRRKSTATV